MTAEKAIEHIEGAIKTIQKAMPTAKCEELFFAINAMKCLQEIATLYIEHRTFGEYPTTKEEYADETMKILDKYKIEIQEKK